MTAAHCITTRRRPTLIRLGKVMYIYFKRKTPAERTNESQYSEKILTIRFQVTLYTNDDDTEGTDRGVAVRIHKHSK